jgi:hypothetical protein
MDIMPLLIMFLVVAVVVLTIAGVWKMFVKAGLPGWGCLVPFYNVYLMLVLGGRPGWWMILFFIPLVNLIVGVVLAIDISKRFGKELGVALGLIFLPFIFYPILGFGDAVYQK